MPGKGLGALSKILTKNPIQEIGRITILPRLDHLDAY